MDLAHLLIESDRAYFEGGARLVGLPGAVLAHMPAFRDVPAAAVVHRVDPRALLPDPLTWAVAAETVLADLGLPRSRFYLDRAAPELELALTMLGYRSRHEVGLARPAARTTGDVQLAPIRDATDWDHKLAVHTPPEEGPDGFALEARRWIAFEESKQAAGYFRLYLAMQDGVPCGAVGLHRSPSMLRLKNLVVASAHRRRGVGAAILDAAAALAHAEGIPWIGCFALAGEPGNDLYRANGFREVVTQVGWDRELVAPVSTRLGRKRVHAYS